MMHVLEMGRGTQRHTLNASWYPQGLETNGRHRLIVHVECSYSINVVAGKAAFPPRPNGTWHPRTRPKGRSKGEMAISLPLSAIYVNH